MEGSPFFILSAIWYSYQKIVRLKVSKIIFHPLIMWHVFGTVLAYIIVSAQIASTAEKSIKNHKIKNNHEKKSKQSI